MGDIDFDNGYFIFVFTAQEISLRPCKDSNFVVYFLCQFLSRLFIVHHGTKCTHYKSLDKKKIYIQNSSNFVKVKVKLEIYGVSTLNVRYRIEEFVYKPEAVESTVLKRKNKLAILKY